MSQVDELIWAAVQPIIKIGLMSGMGVILGWQGLVDKNGEKLLGRLLVLIFLPCLMVSKLGSTLSFDNIVQWWPSSLNVALNTVFGGLLGWFNAVLLQTPKNFRGHVIAACALGNVGNIPLVFVPEVVRNSKEIFGEESEDKTMAYVMLGVWVAVVALFSWGYNILKPKQVSQLNLTDMELSTRGQLNPTNGKSCDTQEDKESPTSLCNHDSAATIEINENSISTSNQLPSVAFLAKQSPIVKNEGKFGLIFKFLTSQLQGFMNPPMYATIIALVIGLIPVLQRMIFDEDGALKIFGSTLNTMGDATIPAMMILLGVTISKGPRNAKVPVRTIVGVSITKLIGIPVVTSVLLYFVIKNRWVPIPDRVFAFVLLSQCIVPSAINLTSIAALHQNQTVELSLVLFWQYLLAMITMPIFAYVFLLIVQDLDYQ